jgi:CheY-like chemotaxis protein
VSAILFLDDDPERHALVTSLEKELIAPRPPRVRRPKPDHRLDHAWSAEEAMILLDKHRYDVAFLDYDLDAFVPEAPSGMAVVEYIVMLPRKLQPRKVVVHSLNQGTAPERMMRRLEGRVRESYRAPFASDTMVDEMCRFIHGS